MAGLSNHDQIDTIVKQVRCLSRASIIQQCGKMQVLDLAQPLGLNDIYVNVNILETIVGRRRLDITQLLHNSTYEQFNRWELSKITQARVAGLNTVEKYSKLIVLGKPGSGKTTFLKYLAIQCTLGKFQVNQLPIFINIKDWVEAQTPTLLNYLTQVWQPYSITTEQIVELLQYGRGIILLDGLDEIKEGYSRHITQEIDDFIQNFNSNQFVITCRTGQEYKFNNFTEVEIADFDFQQIESFVRKWFASVDPVKSKRFIQKLQENESIKELANNPLLLSLLCLMFQETAELPWNRLELYQEGLNLLLKKWDAKKNITRSPLYKKLSTQQKQDLLGQIAYITFERNEYFFKQQELEQYIADYLTNLLNTPAKTLKNDSVSVLKLMEVQHGLLVERASGIYSFSHLTFQEYFTARQIAICSEPQILETSLQKLVSRITEKRWREVFLLTVGMLRNANYLLKLIKQQVDSIITQDRQLLEFIDWVNYKSQSVNIPLQLAALRAFYLTLGITLLLVSQPNVDTGLELASDPLELVYALDPAFILNTSVAIDLIIDKTLVLVLARAINLKFDFSLADELVCLLDYSIKLVEPQLKSTGQSGILYQTLVNLQQQLPNLEPRAKFEQWWQSNGEAWIEQLRFVTITQRHIGDDWQLSDRQIERLKQYYYANQLLVDCLKQDCYVTRDVRSQIEETILLPVSELAH